MQSPLRGLGDRGRVCVIHWQVNSRGFLYAVKEVFPVTAQRIVSEPGVMMGKPVVEGTRITVEQILEDLGAGETIEQILEAHPRLTREGVLAAVRFGAEALKADVAYPISGSVA